MSNGKNQINTINWTAVFSFSHIFKSFRIAIHPSKILLGLAAIMTIYFSGRVLDRVWSLCGQRVQDGDIAAYISNDGPTYEKTVKTANDKRPGDAASLKYESRRQRHSLQAFIDGVRLDSELSRALEARITKHNEAKNETYDDAKSIKQRDDIDAKKEDWGSVLSDAKDEVAKIRDKIDAILSVAYEDAEKDIAEAAVDEDEKTKRTADLEEDYDNAIRASVKITAKFNEDAAKIKGKLVFESFLAYESQCLSNALRAVRYGNFTTGLDDYEAIVNSKSIPSLTETPKPLAFLNVKGAESEDSAGFLFWILMAVQGLLWMLCNHWFFAVIFLTLALAAWALFGGAMHRIAALHAAREEKISMVQALRFSSSRFLSFFAAPLIPLIIILCLGLFLFLGGLLFGNLGGWLSWIMAVLFPIAIVIGLLIAFLSIGLGGGCGLMYPTIAVEGSDAFDAISRSFSYVFARPWRAMVYGLIALVYGTICYLFVRLFAFLALAATHWFVKGGIFGGGSDLAVNADRMDMLWPAPTFSNFHPPISWEALSGVEALSAGIISIWIYIMIALVAAFGLSFLASSTTVIYYLLRRKVDATDLDDVYVEESEEELAGEVAEALADEAPEADEAEEEPDQDEAPAEETEEEPKKAKKAKKTRKRAKKADKPDESESD
ncbi:MAG: hypothetical protein QGH60_22535 [Phycisphaerae bacterium]|jgi:hypothetical protein|nr:hypothetical protein [Phycisphaerae bacterium]